MSQSQQTRRVPSDTITLVRKTRGNVTCFRPVEARHVPEFWVHSQRDPGLPPTLIGKFDENATHFILHNGVGDSCKSAVDLAAGTSDFLTPLWEA
jgi:hypothetical protein